MGMDLASKEPKATTRMISSRHRPLHTCGVSILTTAHSACRKAQDFNGPVGSTTRRVAKLASFTSPLVYAMLRQWLAILSFADDQILALENVVEKIFPPSNYVFNKIDYLIQIIETFPEKFDDCLDKFPMIAHQVHFDCALVQVVSWLNFLITTLTHWGSGSTREKEIVVDINSQDEPAFVDEANQPAEYQANVDCETKEESPPKSETPQEETETVGKAVNAGITKGTYKEILEKGTIENMEKKSREEAVDKVEKNEKTNVGREEAGKGEEEISDKSDVDSETKEELSPISETPQAETETVGRAVNAGVTKGTYKEILEKGTIENMEKKSREEDVENVEKNEKTNVGREEAGKGEEEISDKSDVDRETTEELSPMSETPQVETETVGRAVNVGVTKGTCKEILEKGTKENMENKSREEDVENVKKNEKINVGREEAGKGEEISDKSNKTVVTGDPILELFESGWLMNPGRGGKGSSMPRSVSYTVTKK